MDTAYSSSRVLSDLESANAYWNVLSWDGLEAHSTASDSSKSRDGMHSFCFSSMDAFAFRCVPFVVPILDCDCIV